SDADDNLVLHSFPTRRSSDLGALGLEALSRGAEHATFVELLPASLDALASNIVALGAGDRSTVKRADAMRFVAGLEPGSFDVARSEEHTSELQSRENLVCRLL